MDDSFLEDYLVKYDQWIAAGKVPHAARIIPLGASLAMQPWVLPTEQVMEILGRARTVAVWPCVCRSHYRRCDKPVEVCLVLDAPAESLVAKGLARRISLEEAAEVLKEADGHGLVHMGLYFPDHGLSALCSCCACCCHELQILRQRGRRDRLARSDYVAGTDAGACIGCGRCVGPCVFGARSLQDGHLVCRSEDCFGCGLCVPACPAGSITMQLRGEPCGSVPGNVGS